MVDDSILIREVARAALEGVPGWSVSLAESGEEGVASALAEPPDAVLLDMMMPGIDGAETLARLRAEPATAGIPVIMITASADPGERGGIAEIGAAGIIAKPFDADALPGHVAGILGWPS